MDLWITRGDTKVWVLTITERVSELAASTPVDLTGKTVRFSAKRREADTAATITGTLVNDPDQVANKGRCTLTLAPAATTALPNARQVLAWDVQVEAGTARYTAIRGRFEIRPEVNVGP